MDTNNDTLIIDKVKLFENMYDIIRVIDPLNNLVLELDGDTLKDTNKKCFDFWKKNRLCDNCISMRAYQENESFVKIEYSDGNIYMISAIPIEYKNRKIVIEILKNITHSLVLDEEEYNNTEHSTAIFNLIKQINDSAIHDALTGIYNRRFIDERLPIDLVNSTNQNKPLVIILADIDYFKNVNDTYGHLAGDCTLKQFTQALSSCLKNENDWIARYGGEEFLICLPDTELQDAVEIAEKMRKTIEEKEIHYEDITFKITSSFGLYCVNPKQKDDLDTYIKYADDKLYLAKNNGRNRVEY